MRVKAGSLDIGIKRESVFLFGFKDIDWEALKWTGKQGLQDYEKESAFLSSWLFSLPLYIKSGVK